MFSLYSKKCEYVLRGLARLGKGSDQKRFRASDFCRNFDLPESFTRKALQELVRVGILQAIQGPGGGYNFAKPPKKITVLEVIEAVEGKDHFDACVMGFRECSARKPCGMHEMWVRLKDRLIHQLREETIGSLMLDVSGKSSVKEQFRGKSC